MKKTILIALVLIFWNISLFSQNITNFNLTDTYGNPHDLYSYLSKKQAVILDFFLVTCGNCAAFVPELEKIYQDYGQNTKWLIVLSMECLDTTDAAINAWKQASGGTYPSIGGSGAKSYWQNNWYPLLGGTFNQLVVIIPDQYGQPQNSTIDFMNIGLMDANKMTQLLYSLTSHGFHTGINNKDSKNNNINIFPNPSDNSCMLTFEKSNEKIISYEVYSSIGKRVSNKQIPDKKDFTNIDTYCLDNGSYFIKVQTNKSTKTLKLIIIH